MEEIKNRDEKLRILEEKKYTILNELATKPEINEDIKELLKEINDLIGTAIIYNNYVDIDEIIDFVDKTILALKNNPYEIEEVVQNIQILKKYFIDKNCLYDKIEEIQPVHKKL